MGDGGDEHCLVRMESRPAGLSVCLPLLVFPCTIKSRSSLLAPAHPGWSWKEVRKMVVVVVPYATCLQSEERQLVVVNLYAYSLWLFWTYTFSGFLPRYGILPGAKFTLRPSLALSYFGSVTARHSSSRHQPNFAALSIGHHLYSTGQHHIGHWPTF